ncbi:FeoC-like transcriptional regulator [Vibrio zhugei]|uniref:FeoC-like transcriptional regulator n=1 Tax=Vibrio zhugei TaxID=2479546 RepID=A0ABV7CEE1_9VIBR|nr:FeoC-like transcriptional regulator [Vibrio zhugei]
MILFELKHYIESHRGCSRRDLAKEFAMSEDGVDAMLAVWIKKGAISRYEDTNVADHVVRVRYGINQADSLSVHVTM